MGWTDCAEAEEAQATAKEAIKRIERIEASLDTIQATVELIYQHQTRTWHDTLVDFIGHLRQFLV